MFVGLVLLHLIQYPISYAPVFSILNFVFVGYIYATLFHIIFTTGNGYEHAPDFPDFSSVYESVVIPILKMLLVFLISFGPLIAYSYQAGYLEDSLGWLLLIYACALLPLGLMIVAMDDVTNLFNPLVIFQAIRSSGMAYVTMILTYTVFSYLEIYLDEAFAGSWILSSLIGAYGVLFNGRLIGGVYRDRLAQDELVLDEDITTN